MKLRLNLEDFWELLKMIFLLLEHYNSKLNKDSGPNINQISNKI